MGINFSNVTLITLLVLVVIGSAFFTARFVLFVRERRKRDCEIYLLITFKDGQKENVGEVISGADLEWLRGVARQCLQGRAYWRALLYQIDSEGDHYFMIDSYSTIPTAIDYIEKEKPTVTEGEEND